MQPTNFPPPPKGPQHRSPHSPRVFYSDSVGCSALRIILLHHIEPLFLGGAFQFQCLGGQIITKAYTFEGSDYDENALQTVCLPSATHEPMQFRASSNLSFIFQGGENVLQKRLSAIDFNFEPIKEAIVNTGFSAILLVTDPPAKIKPIESITGWTIFKPLPMYEPQELSPYYYMTNLVLERPSKTFDFCKDLHKVWATSRKTVAMIIGPKDSGKSTVSKEICNVFLSTRPRDGYSIYYLDCDVGQSEFTPPGLLSIVKVDKPFFSAPFASQIRTFHNSFYYGDVTPASDLDLYISILKQCFTEFFEMSQRDTNALLLINTLGWVENFGKEILDNLVEIFAPSCILALKRGAFVHIPKNTGGHVFFQEAHNVPDNRKISPPKLRDLAITGYFTQCFLKSMNLEVVSFSEVSVRMISFEKIGIFIHPSHLISDKAYLAALNMSTVALCTVPEKFKKDFKWQKLCGKENLPCKIEYSDQASSSKPFFKCIGYGLVRAISVENEKIYIITPADPYYLTDVNVLAIGNDIHTPHWIFQTQNTANAPYLMHTKNHANDFDRLSMPLKIVGLHKRNVFRNR
uniref:Polyribonucleotide 5'-hydroxyl-kinase Clp1 P-loop domain-containing protein n=1 Tax=Panagrolaimus sp. ES5 TaxID=591445 RepID=A0AC34FIB6_9BILA